MSRKGDFIGVYGGKKFWPLDPRPEDVDMIGVAHALSQVCRFNGHTKFHWSIAQHSLLVEDILCTYLGQSENYRMRLLGLLHDASEAYISDLLRPFKKSVNGYKEIEAAVENAILVHCGLNEESIEKYELVKLADDIALMVEARMLMYPDENWEIMKLWKDEYREYEKYIKFVPNIMIKGRFLMTLGELVEKIGKTLDWMEKDWYVKAKENNTIPMFGLEALLENYL